MLTPLDDPNFQSSTTPSNNKSYIIVLSLLFIQGILVEQLSWFGKDEWDWVLIIIALPLVIVYFLLPVFILCIVQILLYWLASLSFWEQGKGWWLQLTKLQHQCTYRVVLISFQVAICCYLFCHLICS